MHLQSSGIKWLANVFLVFTCLSLVVIASEVTKDANTNLDDDNDVDVPELLDAYKDSYITKDTAKKFLQKMKNYRDTHTNTEFKHFVDEIAFKPVKTEGEDDEHIFYDKKYFDYLPTDEATKQQSAGNNKDEDETEEEILPEPVAQRENHRRLKRQTVDYHLEQPNRWYLPARPNNDYLPPVPRPFEMPQRPYVMPTRAPSVPNMFQPVNNRGFFDLQDNFIFDYVYDPTRSGFGAPASVPAGGFARPAAPRPAATTTTSTTRRPWVPPVQQPAAPPAPPPAAFAPPPVTNNQLPKATRGGTTEAPSVFHSSDYDYDLDDIAPISNRFDPDTTETKEPNRCSWAITNCCSAATQPKRERCFQIFRCKVPVDRSCSSDNVLNATILTANFLNTARKK